MQICEHEQSKARLCPVVPVVKKMIIINIGFYNARLISKHRISRHCCGAQINAATTQQGEPDKTGQGYGKKSDLRCRRKLEYS